MDKKLYLPLIIIIVVMAVLAGWMAWEFIPYNVQIEYDETTTALELYRKIDEACKKDFRLKRYNLEPCEIIMDLEKSGAGEVQLKFREPDGERPRIFVFVVNTKEPKGVRVEDWGRDQKQKQDIIQCNEWEIDSDRAIELAIETFENEPDFYYDVIDVVTARLNQEPVWLIRLFDLRTGTAYRAWIHPYTGKVGDTYIQYENPNPPPV